MQQWIRLLWIFFFFCESVTFANGQKVRAFMRETFLACAEDSAESRVKNLREALHTHHEAIIYILKHPNLDALPAEVGWSGQVNLSSSEQGVIDLFNNLHTFRSLFVAPVLESNPNFFQVARDADIATFADFVRQKVQNQTLSDHPVFKLLLDPEKGLGDDSGNMKVLFEKYVPKYIDAMQVEEKLRIAADVLSLPPEATNIQKVRTAVLASNVLVQKMLQLLAKNFRDPELIQAVLEVQANVKPFPWEVMKPFVEKAMGADFQHITGTKYLASGTIGQVYLLSLDTGDSTIVKIRRPGVVESIDRDELLFLSVIDEASLKDAFQKMAKKIREEAIFSREADNTAKGELYIRKDLHINVAKLHERFKSAENVLFLTLARGTNVSKIKYDELSPQELTHLADSMENLLKMWFRRSLYGDAFFHGDAHPGNLFYDEAITENTSYELTVIDFGNASTLEVIERQTFAKLAASTYFNNENGVLLALKQIADEGNFNEQAARDVIRQALSSSKSITEKINDIFETLALRGMRFPENLLMYNRGRVFLEKELVSIQKSLQAKGVSRPLNFTSIYIKESLSAVFKSFPWPGSTVRSLLSAAFFGSCEFLRQKTAGLFYTPAVAPR